jgi:serine/threonine protein kinase
MSMTSIETVKKVTPDDFDVIGCVGAGSFAEVYLVRHKETDKQYALKTLKKSMVYGRKLEKYAVSEKSVLSDSDHPFIIKLQWSFQTLDRLCLVMEYCPRGDLGELLSLEKRLSEDRARVYICEILLALEYLHKHNIIFRDLKPDNILIDDDGHLKLADFGLSRGIENTNDAKTFCGSVAYLAPEMILRQGHGKPLDWYLLGTLLYEMLIGQPPMTESDRTDPNKKITSKSVVIPPYVSPNATSLIAGLL